MRGWCLSASVGLSFLISMAGCLSAIAVSSVSVQEKPHRQDVETKYETHSQIPHLREIQLPATSAQILGQQPAPTNPPATPGEVIAITGVQANPTDNGVEVILQTPSGEQLRIINHSTGNSYIADIPNAQLRLSSGDAIAFSSKNPVAGITEITVTNLDASTIRVTVTGETTLPTVELFDSDAGLIVGLTPAETVLQPQAPATDDETIEIVVTGEQDTYRVPNTSVGTRTNTPLRDIPQSIQVIPQQVIRDQGANRLGEILENAPGVSQAGRSSRSIFNEFNSRGFSLNFLRNGVPEQSGTGINSIVSNIERVEILKGPASVLFGLGSPGGSANVVTKKPLQEPFYAVEATIGNFNSYSSSIDLSGSLDENTDDNTTVLYRLNASANTTESFIDFFDRQNYLVAPSLTWQIDERTELTIDAEYQRITGTRLDYGLPPEGTILPNPNGKIPRNRYRGEPSLDENDTQIYRVGYDLEHHFSENWQVRSRFQTVFYKDIYAVAVPQGLLANKREEPRFYGKYDAFLENYQLDNYVVGRFAIGSIQHQLVAGFNLYREILAYANGIEGNVAPLDVFNPIYGAPVTDITTYDDRTRTRGIGLYLQDQITLAENLIVLLGGRFDISNQKYDFFTDSTSSSQQDEAFSPRVGIVYQPIEPISLYASYSRSFRPQRGRASDNSQFKPERGTQYEIGVKADLTDRLSATLALFHLTRSNVLTTDPNNLLFSIQTGEQRSQGVEFDLSGEILPGWNIFAGLALIDAEITEDNDLPVGNQLNNVPSNSLNLWTTYELQSGSLQGLGFGLGIFYAGERQGDLDNSFQLPSYIRTDAAIFYTRNNFRAALNLRNLFDVEYFTSARGRNNVLYGDPFTVQGTLSWEF
ncbi:TonB-dependent siderophore receptor [Gloeocapsa sp. PCC 7428]|uniref:TonB-dependent receptor n=1 Tax=Gloeocapsa sp. PCC 7428 TaxID=1173026 RepID=UPI0002A6152B|nr:TonB-dependent receptor [Gloeocapsa sp. PCC 7428]AFZ30277.1 TonB-dependent siderophore receptor [Gloeocapsa sp. PCC 7428]